MRRPIFPVHFSSVTVGILRCILFALMICATARVQATPVTISLDNPNQTVIASSQPIRVYFSGTITVSPGYEVISAHFDLPYNASHSNVLLPGNYDPGFLAFVNSPGGGTGTYDGLIFNLIVPGGAAADLYAFTQFSNNPSIFQTEQILIGTEEFSFTTEPISVLVTNGVPDQGSSILLFGLSLATLGLVRSAFPALKPYRA